MTAVAAAAAPSVEELFDADSIVEEAQRREPDAGRSFDYLDGLEALCDSLSREARCTYEGAVATRAGLVQSLVNQVLIRRHMHEHPEIASRSVGRPVFIIGLPRTGTTMLHNVLAQHPDLRCPNLWELMNPAGSRDSAEQQKAADAAQEYVEWYYRSAPRMRMVHPMDARRPDECQRLLTNAFRSPIFWIRFNVPSYAEWFLQHDLSRAYEFHRTQLKNILWRIPGDVPVLKDPFHIWNLDALARAYPEARYIYLHRDPADGVASTCCLAEVCWGARSERVDRHEVGRFWLDHIERMLNRLPEVRRAVDKPILDIRYQDLTRDTFGTVQRICDFIDVPMTHEAAHRVRAFLTENPLRKHGSYTYTAEEFGLDRGELSERFAAYRREYGV
jgi:hypothetical protein